MKLLKKINQLYQLTFLKLKKLFHLLYLSYCEKNETRSKNLIKNFHEFTNVNFRIAISWKARTLSSLFALKDNNCTHLVKFIMENVNNVEKIMLVKRKETVLHCNDPCKF